VASALLLDGPESLDDDRWTLDDRDEELLAPVIRDLVRFTVAAPRAAIVHERDGHVVAAWTADGARRLAQALPPSYSELAGAISARHGATDRAPSAAAPR